MCLCLVWISPYQVFESKKPHSTTQAYAKASLLIPCSTAVKKTNKNCIATSIQNHFHQCSFLNRSALKAMASNVQQSSFKGSDITCGSGTIHCCWEWHAAQPMMQSQLQPQFDFRLLLCYLHLERGIGEAALVASPLKQAEHSFLPGTCQCLNIPIQIKQFAIFGWYMWSEFIISKFAILLKDMQAGRNTHKGTWTI